jgi:acyl dehydratase
MQNKNAEHSNFGKNYDSFEVGDTIKHWPGKTITESDNNLFSLLTMNHHPVHLDQNFAQNQEHGERLVVGSLVFSVVVGMSVSDISGKAIANLGYDKVRHENPVFIGDTIYAETEILNKRISNSNPDRGIVHVRTRAYNQDEEVVLTLERNILVPKEGQNND